jgi:hypothetical protein
VATEWLPPDRPLLAATVRALSAGLHAMALGVMPAKRWPCPDGVSLVAYTKWLLTAGGRNRVLTVVNPLVYALWLRGLERLPGTRVAFLSPAGLALALGEPRPGPAPRSNDTNELSDQRGLDPVTGSGRKVARNWTILGSAVGAIGYARCWL